MRCASKRSCACHVTTVDSARQGRHNLTINALLGGLRAIKPCSLNLFPPLSFALTSTFSSLTQVGGRKLDMLARAFSLKAQDAAQNVKGKEILQENKTLGGRVLYIATSVRS